MRESLPVIPKLRCAVAMSQTMMLPLNAVAGPSASRMPRTMSDARRPRTLIVTRLPMRRPRSRANGAGRMIESGWKSAK